MLLRFRHFEGFSLFVYLTKIYLHVMSIENNACKNSSLIYAVCSLVMTPERLQELTCDFLSNASHSFAQIAFKLILYFLCSFMLLSQCLLWYLELELLKLIFSSYL